MKQDITLKPGRELDALVAEHVMGIRETLAKPEGPTYLYRIGAHLYEEPPAYSRNIAAAWEMLATLAKKGFEDQSIRRYDDAWEVFIGDYTDENSHLADGESAPHAICLAALTAIGYKGKENE